MTEKDLRKALSNAEREIIKMEHLIETQPKSQWNDSRKNIIRGLGFSMELIRQELNIKQFEMDKITRGI